MSGADFRSDNTAGVSPGVMAALLAANAGTAASYGDDEISHALNDQFSVLFGAALVHLAGEDREDP